MVFDDGDGKKTIINKIAKLEKDKEKDELSKKEIEQLDKIIEKLLSVKEYLNHKINHL